MTQTHPYDWTLDLPPIGKWRTAEGSFTDIMGCVLTISKDGTGAAEYYEGNANIRTEPLLWQYNSPGVLRLYVADEEHPTPQDDEDWEDIPYKTDWRTTDTGRSPVLVNALSKSEWMTEERFWILTGPINLIARAD